MNTVDNSKKSEHSPEEGLEIGTIPCVDCIVQPICRYKKDINCSLIIDYLSMKLKEYTIKYSSDGKTMDDEYVNNYKHFNRIKRIVDEMLPACKTLLRSNDSIAFELKVYHHDKWNPKTKKMEKTCQRYPAKLV